jgi:hypothetical protein
MSRRNNLLIADSQENLSRLDAGASCSAAFVYILKDPTSSFICLIFEVGSTQRSPV